MQVNLYMTSCTDTSIISRYGLVFVRIAHWLELWRSRVITWSNGIRLVSHEQMTNREALIRTNWRYCTYVARMTHVDTWTDYETNKRNCAVVDWFNRVPNYSLISLSLSLKHKRRRLDFNLTCDGTRWFKNTYHPVWSFLVALKCKFRHQPRPSNQII